MRCSSLPCSGSKSRTALPSQSMTRKRHVAEPPAGSGRAAGLELEAGELGAQTVGAGHGLDHRLAAVAAVAHRGAASTPASAAATFRQSWNGGVASVALAGGGCDAAGRTASTAAKAARREVEFMALIQSVVCHQYPWGVWLGKATRYPLGVLCEPQHAPSRRLLRSGGWRYAGDQTRGTDPRSNGGTRPGWCWPAASCAAA